MRELSSVKALKKTAPHLLFPKLEDTNSKTALRYISHQILFYLPQTSLTDTAEVQNLPLNGKTATFQFRLT